MRIVETRHLEDCFNGSAVFGCRFDQPWTRQSIARLAGLGRLEYFGDFPRPFFRVRTGEGLEIKGVEGERDCRLTFPRDGRDALERRWRQWMDES